MAAQGEMHPAIPLASQYARTARAQDGSADADIVGVWRGHARQTGCFSLGSCTTVFNSINNSHSRGAVQYLDVVAQGSINSAMVKLRVCPACRPPLTCLPLLGRASSSQVSCLCACTNVLQACNILRSIHICMFHQHVFTIIGYYNIVLL